MRKSVDQLVAEYVARWKGYKVNGKGILVPAVKTSEIAPLFTKSADFSVNEKAYDPKEKQYIGGVANAKEVDRMNEVLNPVGVVAGGYLKNSVLLYQHDHGRPVGQVTVLRPEDNGVHFEGWVGDPKSAPLTKNQEEVRSLIAQRILKAVSVGFIPHEIRMPSYDADGNMVDPAMVEKWEMLELSIVAVPCNAGSLFDMKAKPDQEKKSIRSFVKTLVFPTMGGDGKLKTKPTETEAKKMDEELKELLTKLGVSLDAIAAGINQVKEGQESLLKGFGDLSTSIKGKKPDGEKPGDAADDSEPDKDDDDKKKAVERFEALEKRLGDLEAATKSIHDTLELVAKKFGEQAA